MKENLNPQGVTSHIPISVLYHATPAENIKDIKEHGLLGTYGVGNLDTDLLFKAKKLADELKIKFNNYVL